MNLNDSYEEIMNGILQNENVMQIIRGADRPYAMLRVEDMYFLVFHHTDDTFYIGLLPTLLDEDRKDEVKSFCIKLHRVLNDIFMNKRSN